jgi:hypothetical protein
LTLRGNSSRAAATATRNLKATPGSDHVIASLGPLHQFDELFFGLGNGRARIAQIPLTHEVRGRR